MLLIYGALSLGGIETFYVRLAKARFLAGKTTKILLTAPPNKSDKFLLEEMRKYAKIYFLKDFLNIPQLSRLPIHFLLSLPLNAGKLGDVFKDVRQVHVSSSIFGLFAERVLAKIQIDVPITIGIYHTKEFTWGGDNPPFFEKINRKYLDNIRKKNGVIFFNDKLPNIYSRLLSKDFSNSTVFPIGVLENEAKVTKTDFTTGLKIISVSRLVPFKSYNLWMIGVVKSIASLGVDVIFDIYGDGIMEEEIRKEISNSSMEKYVFLKGSLPYSKFSETVKKYDLFIGSGTALIESSGLGVPCITGIESLSEPSTYGFAADLEGFSYHEDGLFEKLECIDVILKFNRLTQEEKIELSKRHLKWANKFTIDSCMNSFDLAPSQMNSTRNPPIYTASLALRYTASKALTSLICKLKGKRLVDEIYS